MRSAPYAEELWPVPDPWETARAFAGRKHLLFLDSSDRQTELGRYSYISFDPIAWFENPRVEFGQADPFAGLTKRYSPRTSATIPDLPPFQGGFAGLFGYGLIHGLERIPRPQFDEFQVPDLAVGLYDWVLAFDHHQNRAWIIAQSEPRLWGIKRILSNAQPPVPAYVSGSHVVPATSFPLPGHPDVVSNFSKDAYLEVVRRAVEYVHAGDCFQVNLSQRLLAPLKESPLDLYGRLRGRNPAPFGGYFDLGNFVVASTSPERFLKVERHMVETRPIKGTRPRGADENEDRTIIAELSASRKDRAENIMIVDLLRNDLGRVCEYGSIQVPQVCDVESFRFVHHLVSVVTGKLHPDCSPIDLLRATFPGGSVTGAPKVRAAEIISELEPSARGPYCGSLACIGFNGTVQANILIRTFTIGKNWIQFPVGGGIVADSDPEREYEETLHKAAGMLSALS